MPTLTLEANEQTKAALREAAAYVGERAANEAADAIAKGATPQQAADVFANYVQAASREIRERLIDRLYDADGRHKVRDDELDTCPGFEPTHINAHRSWCGAIHRRGQVCP